MSDVLRRRYVVGLGANLGEQLKTLRSAVISLGSGVQRLSHLYQSAAVGPPQPDYLNAALLFESELSPRGVLELLLEVERAHGRQRRERWGPRTLDLDVLHSPGLVVEEPGLVLPHPELDCRAFALTPLLDVLPDACDARSGRRYDGVLASLEPGARAGVRRVETSQVWDPRAPLRDAPGRTE